MDSLHTEEGQHVHYDALRPLALDVVSVQSMVVYGRVGNNVAWPVLQRAGLEAAIVPTVLFSNTPHYASIHGGAIPDDWFAGYLADLEARGAWTCCVRCWSAISAAPTRPGCWPTGCPP